MRITLEADYAVRIVDFLANSEKRTDAKKISENTDVTLRFTLKILRKLVIAGIVRSFKGVQGGYELRRAPGEINLKDVIEAVDGPILINRCIGMGTTCGRPGNPDVCVYQNVFADISEMVKEKLTAITFDKKSLR